MIDLVEAILAAALTLDGKKLKPDSEKLPDQGLVVYKMRHEQIAFLKKQQWTITNYVALIYGTIFAVKKGLPTFQWPLAVAALVAGGYGVFLLIMVQTDLGNVRKEISSTDQLVFGANEYAALGMAKEKRPYSRGLLFTIGLMLVLAVGALIIVAYVLCGTST